jgi:peroxin-1
MAFQDIHASLVENTLLSHVRVANVGQEIDVWVLSRTRVRLRVGASLREMHSSLRAETMIQSISTLPPRETLFC